jgi:hypothetical protein
VQLLAILARGTSDPPHRWGRHHPSFPLRGFANIWDACVSLVCTLEFETAGSNIGPHTWSMTRIQRRKSQENIKPNRSRTQFEFAWVMPLYLPQSLSIRCPCVPVSGSHETNGQCRQLINRDVCCKWHPFHCHCWPISCDLAPTHHPAKWWVPLANLAPRR